jgi:2',3'-cyclic-nucleotide 2'-phosphodiesterase (5'-nucleotidase family)
VADFTQPYALFEVNGVQVGAIGLATLATPSTTNPRNLTGLDFTPYEDALREFVPEMREQGAQVVVALTHVCMDELADLARATDGLVDAMFAGHCNETGTRTVAGTTILGSGTAWRSYARLTLAVDAETGAIVDSDAAVVDVAYPLDAPPVTPDPAIAALVARWETAANAELDEPVAYATESIARQSSAMLNLVTDAWLWAYPAADMTVTNTGGFRQDLPAGTLTRGDIVGMLPFDNTLIAVNVTGAQLLDNLRCCGGAIAGLTVDGDTATLADGTPLDPDATYTVLINDFMYFGGDGYLFGVQDPDGYDTGINWRQPVFDYLLSLETRADNPLEDWLDTTNRLR